jgi:hypothetical protein
MLTKEMKRIVRLRALHRLAQRSIGPGTLVFDEGPVYLLARMLVFGGDNIRTRGFERWWRGAVAAWAATLHAVVWLEAPDDVLATRIHTRRQRHPYQGAAEGAVSAFLCAYRAAFSRVLAGLRDAGGPEPWILATDAGSADQSARCLLARLRARGAASVVAEATP